MGLQGANIRFDDFLAVAYPDKGVEMNRERANIERRKIAAGSVVVVAAASRLVE